MKDGSSSTNDDLPSTKIGPQPTNDGSVSTKIGPAPRKNESLPRIDGPASTKDDSLPANDGSQPTANVPLPNRERSGLENGSSVVGAYRLPPERSRSPKAMLGEARLEAARGHAMLTLGDIFRGEPPSRQDAKVVGERRFPPIDCP
jgi:hypothetical protein